MKDERRQQGQEQLQQGSTGQRSKGQGGGGEQAQKIGRYGGQQGGKAGLRESDQRSQDDEPRGVRDDQRIDQPGGTGNDSSTGQREAQPRRERQLGGVDAEEEARMAPNSQGNLGTTQREWSGKDNPNRTGEE